MKVCGHRRCDDWGEAKAQRSKRIKAHNGFYQMLWKTIKKKGKNRGSWSLKKTTRARIFFSRAVKIRQGNANRLSKCVHFIRLPAALTKKSHNKKKNGDAGLVWSTCRNARFVSNNFQLMPVRFLLQTQIMVQYLIPTRLSLKILTALNSICNVSASDCSRKIHFRV